MKKIYSIVTFLYALATAWGQQTVDRITIEKAAVNTHKLYFQQGSSEIKKINSLSTEKEADLVHVVEYESGGFSVISGDWSVAPILGYSLTGVYDTLIIPPGLNYLINRYKYDMELVRQDTTTSGLKQGEGRNAEWDELLNLAGDMQLRSTPQPKDILIVTQWGQNGGKMVEGITFNSLCPPKSNGESGNCPAGCTAVAMAQVLNYWACRVNPTGSFSYSRKGETLSVDFGNTIYDWNKMIFRDSLGIATYDAATLENSQLIYHAGISCKMSYHDNWSYAPPGRARDALVSYWGMKPEANVKQRIFNLRKWDDMLRAEIVAGRPVIYSGIGSDFDGIFQDWEEWTDLAGGHSWVIDGYDGDKFFHCNWGWGGYCDGWYSVKKFAPYDEAKGTHQGNYSFWEMAIFNVEPVQPAGVGTPQFNTSYITAYYDIEGEELEVAPSYGATRYEWTTDRGTIKSDGSNKATLYAAEDAHVKVRACNELCGDYSPYTGINVNIKDVPEIERKYSTGNTQEYYISHIPENIPVSWTLDNTADFTITQTMGKYITLRSNNIEGTGTLKAHVQLQGFNDLYLETSINTTPWKLDVSGSLLCGQYTFAPTAVFPHTESFKWSVSEGVEILSETNDTTLRVDLTGERTDVWVQLEVVQNGKTYTTREDLHVTVIRNVDVQIVDRWEEDGKWKALLHAELDPGGRYGYYDWRIKGELIGIEKIALKSPYHIEACMPDYENPYEIWPELPFDTVGIIKRDTIGYILNSNSEPLPPLDDLPPMIPSFNPSYAVATYPAGREAEVTCTLITPCKSVAGKAVLAVHTHAPSYSASYNRTTRTIQVDRTDGGTTGGTKHEASGLAPYQLRLYDNFGPVSTLDFDPAAATVFMPLGDLPDGSYYVNVADDKGEVIVRQYISAY